MQRYIAMLHDELLTVTQIMPWDAAVRVQENPDLLILDVREPGEFATMHIKG